MPGSDGTQCVAGDRILFMNIHRTLGPVPNLLPPPPPAPRHFRLETNSVDGLCPSDFSLCGKEHDAHGCNFSVLYGGGGVDTPLS